MRNDLRETPLYAEVAETFRRSLEPGLGRVSHAHDVTASPDGRRIAFTGTRFDDPLGSLSTRVHIFDIETKTLTEVSSGPCNDRLPRWSPDGTRLAFISDQGEAGVYRLALTSTSDPNTRMKTPGIPGNVESVSWSPDGKTILLRVAEPGADQAGAAGSGKDTGSGDGLPSWIPDVQRGGEGWRRAWVFDCDNGDVRRVSPEGLNVWECAWCGPGRVAAIASDMPEETAWYDTRVAVIDIETGTTRTLLAGSGLQFGLPAASPSGRHLAVVEAVCSDRILVAGDVLLIDPDQGTTRRLDTRGVDVTFLNWRNEEYLFYMGVKDPETAAGEYDAGSDRAALLWTTTETCGGNPYPEGSPISESAFASICHGYERPPELVIVRDGVAHTLLSFSHEGSSYIRSIAGHLEEVTWQAPDTLEIRGLLVQPERPGPHPLVVVVHGGPVWAFANSWYGIDLVPLLAARGYAVLMPNPRGSCGRGRAFAEMVFGDPGGADAQDILAGVDALTERGIVDPARVGVTGVSYGGYMACWLVARTDRFAAAVGVSPLTDWYTSYFNSNIGFAFDRALLREDPAAAGSLSFARSPLTHAGQVKSPVMLIGGAEDLDTPPAQCIGFFRALVHHGVEAELVMYPNEGHGVRRDPSSLIDYLTRVIGWFDDHVPRALSQAR